MTPLDAMARTEDAADLPSDIDTVDGHARQRQGAAAMPARVGRYAILRALGEGGMGIVLEAFDPELDRRVAVKLLRPTRIGSRASRRLLREAQVMARLSHPNVVQVYDAGVVDGRVFLAMELVRGRTLRAWLDDRPRGWREVLQRFVDAGRGIAAAHEAGIIHRDFKPENVLIAEDGRVRVADFGLANCDDATHDSPVPSARPRGESTLTSTGAVVGTPVYMAPEQHAGLEVDAAADQFSFCVALHEALYGQRPFAGTSAIQVAANVLAGRYVDPPRPRRAPRWLAEVLRRGLSVERDARWPGFPALLAALERDPAVRRRRWVGAALLVNTIATTGWALATRTDATPCDSGEARIGAVWNDDARVAMTEALGGSARFDALAGEKVVDALDRYAGDWAEAHEVTCVAHHEGEISSELLDSAMNCLQLRHAAIERFVELVRGGDPRVLARASAAAVGLPPIASCTDRHALTMQVAPPEDPDAAMAVDRLRERLTRAEVAHDAGSIESAQAELEDIERGASALAYAPLVAEVSLVSGRKAMDRFEWAQAAAWLSNAAAKGLAAGTDAIAAEALARKLFVDGMLGSNMQPVLADVPLVTGLVERVGAPRSLAAMLANNVGVLHGLDGDARAAVEQFSSALELAGHASEVSPIDRAGYAMNLALHTDDADARDRLFVGAMETVDAALGRNHLRYLDITARRAECTTDPEKALPLTLAACSAIVSQLPDDYDQCHMCYWRLAEIQEELGHDDAALAAVQAAAGCFERAVISDDADYVEAMRAKVRAYEAVLEHRWDAALLDAAAARTRMAPHAMVTWIATQLADVAVLEARSLIALGRGAEAKHGLEAAIAAYDERARINRDRAWTVRRARAQRLLDSL